MRQRAHRDGGAARHRAFAIWLLLFSIFTHAVVPLGSPLNRPSGSAFSAFTSDVSIAPNRKSTARQSEQLSPAQEESAGGAGSAEPDAVVAPFVQIASLDWESTAAAPEPTSLTTYGGAASFQPRAPPFA